MRILIVSDAWQPQVNGVVRTLQATARELERAGHAVAVIGPDRFWSFACPGYREIRLALPRQAALDRMIGSFLPDALHIATEGPLGIAARRWCLARGLPFSTAYHTHFPDYLALRAPIPPALAWRYIRWFHGPAQAVLVSTATLAEQLRTRGITQSRLWGRGVDLAQFHPRKGGDGPFASLPRPVLLHVGRVAVEKNIEAFLALDFPGTKVVVGDGPARAMLEARHPEARFTGALSGDPLAAAYADADVLVFPSRTDTFGLVMIEALASGTPVAAYPVPGPRDVLTEDVGAMAENLGDAVHIALTRDRAACAAYGAEFSWQASMMQFLDGLAPFSAPCKAA